MAENCISHAIYRSLSSLGENTGVSDLDHVRSGVANVNLAVEGSSGRFESNRDSNSLVAVALNGMNEFFLNKLKVTHVLALSVDNVKGSGESLAEGGGNNLEVKFEVDHAGFVGGRDVIEAELANFDFAGSGSSMNVHVGDG